MRLPGAHLDHQHAQRYYFHDITDNFILPRRAKLASLEQIQDILELTATLQATDKLLADVTQRVIIVTAHKPPEWHSYTTWTSRQNG
jgi:hypothetical protein